MQSSDFTYPRNGVVDAYMAYLKLCDQLGVILTLEAPTPFSLSYGKTLRRKRNGSARRSEIW